MAPSVGANPLQSLTVAHARAAFIVRSYGLSQQKARELVDELGYDADALEAAARRLSRRGSPPG